MRKNILIILSVLVVILFTISIVLISYKLNNEFLNRKGVISHSTFLEVVNFNEPFENYNLSGVTYSKDDMNTLIDMIYKNNINEVETDYQYITIPVIPLQFHNQTYELKSIYEVEKLKSEIEMEDSTTYSFYTYYDENTGLICKIKIICSHE